MMIFGICLVPVLIASGVAVDYSERSKIQAEMQAVVDSAALAAAREKREMQARGEEATEADLREVAERYVSANFPTKFIFGGEAVRFDRAKLTVTIDDTGMILGPAGRKEDVVVDYRDTQLPTTMMKIAGINNMEVHVVARAGMSSFINKLNLFIVLDTSPSMSLPKGNVLPRMTPWTEDDEKAKRIPGYQRYANWKGCYFTCHDDGSLNRNYMIPDNCRYDGDNRPIGFNCNTGGNPTGSVLPDYEPKMDVIRAGLADMLTKISTEADKIDPGNADKTVAYFLTRFNYKVETDNDEYKGRVFKAKHENETDVRSMLDSLKDPIMLGRVPFNLSNGAETVNEGTNLNVGLAETVRQIKTSNDREKRHNIVVFVSDGVAQRDSGAAGQDPVTYIPPACKDLQKLEDGEGKKIDVEVYTIQIETSLKSYQSAFDATLATGEDLSGGDSPRIGLRNNDGGERGPSWFRWQRLHFSAMRQRIDAGTRSYKWGIWDILKKGGTEGGFFTSGLENPDGSSRGQSLMKACASDADHAFSGEFGDSIEKAFDKLVVKLTNSQPIRLLENASAEEDQATE